MNNNHAGNDDSSVDDRARGVNSTRSAGSRNVGVGTSVRRGRRNTSTFLKEEIDIFLKSNGVEPVSSSNKPIFTRTFSHVSDTERVISVPVDACAGRASTSRKKAKVDKSSLKFSEGDFLDASDHRSEAIVRYLSNCAASGSHVMGAESLVKKGVYAAFQALHFLCASSRAVQWEKSGTKELQEFLAVQGSVLSETEQLLDAEMDSHGETLVRLHNSLVASARIDRLENELAAARVECQQRERETAIKYSMLARIQMLMEPPEKRCEWNLKDEIGAFKFRYPEIDLQEWGIPDLDQ